MKIQIKCANQFIFKKRIKLNLYLFIFSSGCDDTVASLSGAGVLAALAACRRHTSSEGFSVLCFKCLSLAQVRVCSAMSMYQVKPVSPDIKIDLPTCMYKLPNIHTRQENSCSSDHVLQVTAYWFNFSQDLEASIITLCLCYVLVCVRPSLLVSFLSLHDCEYVKSG